MLKMLNSPSKQQNNEYIVTFYNTNLQNTFEIEIKKNAMNPVLDQLNVVIQFPCLLNLAVTPDPHGLCRKQYKNIEVFIG